MPDPTDHTIAERVRAEPSADAITAGWAAFWDSSDTMPNERVIRAIIAAYRAILLSDEEPIDDPGAYWNQPGYV